MRSSPDSRDTCEKRIISQHVFDHLWDKHRQYQIPDMEYSYNQLQAGPTTADFARWIFEFRIHQLLRGQQTIRIFSIGQDRHRLGDFIYNDYLGVARTFRLSGSDEHNLVEGAACAGVATTAPNPPTFRKLTPSSSLVHR